MRKSIVAKRAARGLLFLWGTTLVGPSCGGGSSGPTTPAPTPTPGPPPNIVFILTDDLDMQSLPYMPKLKSLIGDAGVTFSNSFVSVSVCCPSRASILTGQHAHNTGILTNIPPRGGYERFLSAGGEASTIATWLKGAGYRTIFLGKYLNGYPAGSPSYVPAGWDDWHADFADGDGAETIRDGVYYDYFVNDNGAVTFRGNSPGDYETDVLTQKALDALKLAQQAGSQPLFMYLAPRAPHRPATRPPRYVNFLPGITAPVTPNYNEADLSAKPAWLQAFPLFTPKVVVQIDQLFADRLATLQAVDDMIERIVGELSAEGKLANTYVFVTSDNGFLLGPHRFPHGKEAPYEESMRVPMLVRGPTVPAGQTRDALVFNLDLPATFLEWARAPLPDSLEGRSLAGLIRNGTPADWRKELLLEHYQLRGAGDGDVAGIPDFAALRTADYTYVEYATGEGELYDVRRDPYELSNQYRSAPDAILKPLADRLAALRGCRGSSCR